MMPEIGNALLCLALGVALLLSVIRCGRGARRCAHDGLGEAILLAAVYPGDGRVSGADQCLRGE